MAAIKQQVIHMIESLPDEVTVDDIMAELYFRLQVDAGLKELDEGDEGLFCQSCGMPMKKTEDFGTNADKTKSKENDWQ